MTALPSRRAATRTPHPLLRLLKNIGRSVKTTGPYFLLGVLMAATVGVPLYACGGGTIPLLQAWLLDGMSPVSYTHLTLPTILLV